VVSKKAIAKPSWLKNTYFWWSAALFILGIGGLIRGARVIRDPGQTPERHLALWYLLAGVVMAIGGYISHIQTVDAYNEALEDGVVLEKTSPQSGEESSSEKSEAETA
jgi:hypothetical protein